MQLPVPARSIHLRAAFDRDPSTYIGRFLPDRINPEEIDENAAVLTECSKFVKPRLVEAMQDVDETVYVSRKSETSIGIAPIVALSAAQESQRAVRVRYRTMRKLQADIDAEGLVSCCRADPTQCSGTMIGEFVMGTGSILQRDETRTGIGVDGQEPRGATLHASHGAGEGWRAANEFENVYFAFLTTATPARLTTNTPALSASDCSWCENLPKRLDGKYFCGVSSEASSESQARELALTDARVQAVKFVGESITTRAQRQASVNGLLEDERVVVSASQGIASHVKDEVWCKAEPVPTPDGLKYRTKVLAFIGNNQLAPATHELESLLQSSRTPEEQPMPMSRSGEK